MRRLLWDELAGMVSWWNMPYCIGGTQMYFNFQAKDWAQIL